MGSVKTTEDIFKTLYALHLAKKYPLLQCTLIRENKNGRIELNKDISTKKYLEQLLDIADRTVTQRLRYLEDNNLVEVDHNRSYRVANRAEKTQKWVYSNTAMGESWLRANKDITRMQSIAKELETKFKKIRKSLKTI